MKEKSSEMAGENGVETVQFHYTKSPFCRDIPVSGAFGGISRATGEMHISVYSERPTIPQTIHCELLSDGKLGDEIREMRNGKEGWVRIIQDTLFLDFAAAVSLRDWLTGHIDSFREAHPELFVEEMDAKSGASNPDTKSSGSAE